MAGRVLAWGVEQGRKQLEQEWKGLRRGWYLGGAEFRERLLEVAGQRIAKSRRSSHSGAAKREHGEGQAERLVRLGLVVIGWPDRELQARPKAAMEKQVLAWWVCHQTTVRRRWVRSRK